MNRILCVQTKAEDLQTLRAYVHVLEASNDDEVPNDPKNHVVIHAKSDSEQVFEAKQCRLS